jgi:hypothetical protein
VCEATTDPTVAARASPNDSPNVFFRRRPDSNQLVRICGLKDVAWGPNVETGVSAPSDSGGGAVWLGVFCRWGADPGANVGFRPVRGL